MITTYKILIFLSILFINKTEINEENKITLKITNIRNTNGYMRVAVYNIAQTYLDEKITPYREYALQINGDCMTLEIENLPNQYYAIAILHDENKDKKMESNWLGIPSEGWGFSNNIFPMLKKPSFDACKIEPGKQIEIKTNYL